MHVNGYSFSYEKLCTKARFEKEVQGNLEMACCKFFRVLSNSLEYVLPCKKKKSIWFPHLVQSAQKFDQSACYGMSNCRGS